MNNKEETLVHIDALIKIKRQEFREICERDMPPPSTAELIKGREIFSLVEQKVEILAGER